MHDYHAHDGWEDEQETDEHGPLSLVLRVQNHVLTHLEALLSQLEFASGIFVQKLPIYKITQ